MEQSDVGKIYLRCSTSAMKLPHLRILSLLLSFAVFEVSVFMPFIIQNDFGPDEWFRSLVFVSSPFVAMSQVTLLAMWGGLGAPAMHRRIFYAATCCVACSLIPVAFGRFLLFQEMVEVWMYAVVIPIAFAFCLGCSLIFGRLFRRRLVALNRAGVVSFATKSQFSLRFLAIISLTVAILCLAVIACRLDALASESAPIMGLLLSGVISGLFFFAQGIAFAWIFLRPEPITPWTFIWLAITAAVFLSLYFAIWLVSVWWNSATRDFRSFLPLLAAGVAWLSCSMASLCIMRYLDFRLVRNEQLNEVAKDPMA